MHSSDTATAGEDLLTGFQEHLRTEGVSHRTRSAYAADLRDFVRCCGSTLPAAVTASEIERYIGDQTSRGIGRASLRRRLCGIRRFFAFLVTRGDLKEGLTTPSDEMATVIEANIDDMNPQIYEYVMERLLKERGPRCLSHTGHHEERKTRDKINSAL